MLEEAGWGGVMEAAPWLFSERDVRDLIRLKKPLFLDSRFLSAASCVLEDGLLTVGSLEKIKNSNRIRKQYTFIQSYKSTTSQKGFHTVRKHLVTFLYADDTQLYFAFNPTDFGRLSI